MPREYERLWPDCKVKHLILSSDRFIVFLDDDLDVDWATSEKYDEQGHADSKSHNAIMNTAALLEATPCDSLSKEVKEQFKRLIGEGIARSLDHDYAGAHQILQSASGYILARSQEISRWWYLSASATASSAFVLIGFVLWWGRLTFLTALGEVAFWSCICAIAGAVGALLSVIGRTGRLMFDCSAGKRLHYLEGASRIVAGAISGLLVGLAVRSGLILAVLTQGNKTSTIMVLAGLAAGSGERLATSIISEISSTGAKSMSVHGGQGRAENEIA